MSSTAEKPLSATATATSTSTSSTTLDKPLHQLTEDDISQLTREDCRRYLKQKGMRRPSWNKSQAIQQVIMLKSLLEPTPDSSDGGRKLYISSRQQQQTLTTRVQKGTSVDTEISLSAEESVPGHRNDIEKADFLGDNDYVPSGIGSGIEEVKAQMTILYSGKVNVYDDMPADKALALLQLAASPLQFPQEDPSINVGPQFPAMLSSIPQTMRMSDNYPLHREESNVLRGENSGSASRKASVQRYLEKRKDRFKRKRKAGGSTSDVYVNHQIGVTHNVHEQSSRSATCSPPNTPNRFS